MPSECQVEAKVEAKVKATLQKMQQEGVLRMTEKDSDNSELFLVLLLVCW